MDESRYSITSDYDNVDWEKVIKILMAYSLKLICKQKFRAYDIKDMAYDFSIEAITQYLEHKDKFDPSRNPDLLKYLKLNILRRLISNYSNSADNIKISQIQINDLNLIDKYVEEMQIDETIDIKKIVTNIQKEIDGDTEMSIIFAALYEENMKRSEICKEFSIEVTSYNNTLKRLKRIVEKHLN